MKVAVCFNRVPPTLRKGQAQDRISEEGAEAEAQAVAAALQQLGHHAAFVPLGPDLAGFIAELQKAEPAVVFNLCEGFWGDSHKEMHIAALFELLGLPFTGSPALVLGLSQDKARCKDILARHGLPTPRYAVVGNGNTDVGSAVAGLHFPLIVKPALEDASLGISADSIVDNDGELRRRVRYVHEAYHQAALIEEFIDGREINAALIGGDPAEALPLSEIRFLPGLKRPIVSYEGKWLETSAEYRQTQPCCPAELTPAETSRIGDVAGKAFALLGCRDYGRVDLRLRDGMPYILEVNANPDISPDAGLARSARAAGLAYTDLIERILHFALSRKEPRHAA